MATAGVRLALLAADFNEALVAVMIRAAQQEVEALGATVVRVVRVPGCYEVPLLADLLLGDPATDVLVVLGYIEKGETLHGEVMGHVVHASLVRSQLAHKKPVGIGIIGPGATPEQAEARKESYARSAVRAALTSLQTYRELADGRGHV